MYSLQLHAPAVFSYYYMDGHWLIAAIAVGGLLPVLHCTHFWPATASAKHAHRRDAKALETLAHTRMDGVRVRVRCSIV